MANVARHVFQPLAARCRVACKRARLVLLIGVPAVLVLTASRPALAAVADSTLQGTVVDAGNREPVAGVRIILDSLVIRISAPDGSFDFGSLAAGNHILAFEHIAYSRHAIRCRWPHADLPLVVQLQPTHFVIEPIDVTAERPLPSLPVSAVSFDRAAATLTPGNIANDPLRTVQSHPSAATAGIDFLSTMAVRGGNTEEHRVYFDELPLRHYTHVGGFSSVVYDDILASTVLVPGAAPIRYKGALSGVVMFMPENPDTSSLSLRYDITSLAGALTRVVSPSLKWQASAKSDFFNLPVYQQVGVQTRGFKDLLARAIVSPREALTLTPTLLLARDSETGVQFSGVGRERKTSSVLAGVELSYRPSDWEFTLRPYYSYYRSRDALTWSGSAREHRLSEAHLFGEIGRQGTVIGVGISGELGAIRHEGHGGDLSDAPFSASSELRFIYRDAVALVLGGGGSREEWTSTLEPEAYGSLRIGPVQWLTVSGAYRRSHQSPFLFAERRDFASIPIDAGDLWRSFTAGEDARAVRMDQTSVEARVSLPFRTSIEGNGFWRRYDDLLLWDWSDFPVPGNVANGGSGRGHGYEITIARHDPDFLSVVASVSRARVWKTEGTLTEERTGDFDKPDAWQVGGSVRLSKSVRLSMRWTDVEVRPYTPYDEQTTPPTTEQINSVRLDRFRRLDVKLTFDIVNEAYGATFFVDIVNFFNRRNIATTYALELSPGQFTTVPYGGTRFFPIGGITLRW